MQHKGEWVYFSSQFKVQSTRRKVKAAEELDALSHTTLTVRRDVHAVFSSHSALKTFCTPCVQNVPPTVSRSSHSITITKTVPYSHARPSLTLLPEWCYIVSEWQLKLITHRDKCQEESYYSAEAPVAQQGKECHTSQELCTKGRSSISGGKPSACLNPRTPDNHWSPFRQTSKDTTHSKSAKNSDLSEADLRD